MVKSPSSLSDFTKVTNGCMERPHVRPQVNIDRETPMLLPPALRD
jgi:hypothetical protein